MSHLNLFVTKAHDRWWKISDFVFDARVFDVPMFAVQEFAIQAAV